MVYHGTSLFGMMFKMSLVGWLMRWLISWFTSCLLIHIQAMIFLAGARKVTACAIKGSEMGHEVLQLVR